MIFLTLNIIIMKIDTNTVAEVAYKILLEGPEGKLIEYADEDYPRQIMIGRDDLITGFEEGLKGKTTGSFSFSIDQNKAFGPRHDALMTEVPKQAFTDEGKIRKDLLFVGNKINMLDNQGHKLTGYVIEVKEDTVLMDFNHPLAGKNLFVIGEVLSVREVSETDMTHEDVCGCGSECDCQTEAVVEEESCEVCGNPAEKMGQGYGDCQCGS